MQDSTVYFQDNIYYENQVDESLKKIPIEDLSGLVNIYDKQYLGVGTSSLTENSQDTRKHSKIARYESTDFLKAYFSTRNIRNIQNLLKQTVHNRTGVVIDDQSVDELLNTMGYVYELHGRHPPKLNSEQLDVMLKKAYINEIDRLNKIVLGTIAKQVIIELKMQLYYLQDLSNPRLADRPQYLTSTGEKQYNSIIQTLTGIPDDNIIIRE